MPENISAYRISGGRIWDIASAAFVDSVDDETGVVDLYRNGKPADEEYLAKTLSFYGYSLGEFDDDSGASALIDEKNTLLETLSSSTSDIGDWKIIKSYEYAMTGKDAPYDLDELHEARDAVRARINEIEEQISALASEAS